MMTVLLALIISGVVSDDSGLAVPGAAVRVVHETSNAAVDAVTDIEGRYRVEVAAPGAYRVEVTLDGFEPSQQRVVVAAGAAATADVKLLLARFTEGIVVTARRVEEVAQEVPIPVSVLAGRQVADAGAFNVNRLKELVPTVQFYSSNPRNSSINIRGLGAPFGLTNDGIEPGVGMYIDGAFFARPAAATLDFIDVERIEVLRGPQGTLFGKNTTAGAISVTTRKPTFSREGQFELNYGNYDFVQAKASFSGPLAPKLAGRVSFSGTTRGGLLTNVRTGQEVNTLNNLGFRGQVLYAPSDRAAVTLSVDNTRQRPVGYAQVVAGVAPTLRPANRQYAGIAADLGYAPPSFNAFDRLVDTDTPWQSNQDLGGASLTAEFDAARGRVTAISGWRYWNWDPSNDRDFVGLPITTVSANPSRQRQWSQEVRYAGDLTPDVGIVLGAFAFHQSIHSTGNQEQGAAAARFLLAPGAAAATPGLLDGYGMSSDIRSGATSAALFGQVEWSISDRVRVLPGLRVNYDRKDVQYDARIFGGLQTSDPALVALQRSVLAPQFYTADVDDTNVSGQLTVAVKATERVNTFATYANSFKSVGLNLAGVPTDAAGQPALAAATVRPEDVRHLEVGMKTEPLRGVTANVTAFNTDVRDYQAQVVNAQVGVLRGYLANAEQVRVRGAELDAAARVGSRVSLYGAVAYTDGTYVSFPDAPPPLELTGGPQVVDVSGSALPGISKWATTLGGEYTQRGRALHRAGEYFAAVDTSYRSAFSSSATASRYLVIDGYSLLNTRVGFRWSDGWALTLWTRNLLDKDYYELLSAAPGNSGLYVGLPGEPRTFGVTFRLALRSRP